MVRLTVDLRSRVPIYAQLVEQVRRLIASGELPAGTQLPTVRQLAADLRVNFNTVARAYRALDDAGLITTRQGRGTYVLEASAVQGDRLRHTALVELVHSMLAEASRLGFGPETVAAEIERQHRAEQATIRPAADASASAQEEEMGS